MEISESGSYHSCHNGGYPDGTDKRSRNDKCSDDPCKYERKTVTHLREENRNSDQTDIEGDICCFTAEGCENESTGSEMFFIQGLAERRVENHNNTYDNNNQINRWDYS